MLAAEPSGGQVKLSRMDPLERIVRFRARTVLAVLGIILAVFALLQVVSLARQVLTPLDIERVFGLTGGNIFQGAMTPGQLFSLRPVPGHAGYRTPVAGLYLCGAAAHPGGGVMGSPGWNAAREILRRRRRFLTT